ncbi:unnamed protein product [Penicillium camemberti]|uniref:Str. FM013 n=1 Tax=Penicillium camemberti (strain FM 013) TaxID=1429867 RepID=A0A0G4P4K2_PENC3|nr:unnamed protein product [Penicillium camemberti]
MYTKYGGSHVGGLRCVDQRKLDRNEYVKDEYVVGSISLKRFFIEMIRQSDSRLDLGSACWIVDC